MKFSKTLRVMTFILTLTLGFFTARGATVPIDSVTLDSIKHDELSQVQVNALRARAHKAKAKIPATQISGNSYAEWDYTSSAKCFSVMSDFTIDGDSITITNFFNYGVDVKGTYDPETSIISLPVQTIYTLSPYGDFNLCYFSPDQMAFSDKIPVRFQVNEDGTMDCIDGWVLIVSDTDSKYRGSAIATCYQTKYYKANAKMVGNQRDITNKTFFESEYPLYVFQETSNVLTVANFAAQGHEVKIYLNSDKSVVVEPQALYYSSYSGARCVYPATWGTTSKGTNSDLLGTGTESKITFGPWGLFLSSSLTTCYFGMEYSDIVLNDGMKISYPDASDYTFSGNGTEASPYLISSDQDLAKLSIAVNAGNSYKGAYFKQTQEIDCSSINGTVRPIGLTASAPFAGTYDGGGYKLRNLTIERGTSQYTGLFGYADSTSVIKNVYIYNGNLKSYGKYSGLIVGNSVGTLANDTVIGVTTFCADYGGGIAGAASNVDKCYFRGTITTYNANIGGIAGEVGRGTIRNCSVEAIINSSVSSASITHAVGGVVGNLTASKTNNGLIEDCYFMGTMYDSSGYANLGGVVGAVSSYCVARRCTGLGLMSTVVKSSSVGACGGVIGSLSWGSAEDCYASNNIQGSTDCSKVGGIAGSILYSSSIGEGTHLSNCLFTGQVILNGLFNTDAAIYGKTDNTKIVTNCYYDAQMEDGVTGDKALTTAQLTAGTAISGLSTDNWKYTAGRYPVVKSLPDNVADYAATTFFLDDAQSASSIRSNFTLGSSDNISWSIYSSGDYVTETSAMKIDGNSVQIKKIMSTQYLVAKTTTEGGSFYRLYKLTIAPSQYEGTGTASDPYLIKTVDDFRNMNDAITNYNITFNNEYFKLANDIDFTGVKDFWGVSDQSVETQVFNGTFDGDNHYINNWCPDGIDLGEDGKYLTSSSSNSHYTVALFAFVGPNGTIKNLNIGSSCNIRGIAGIGAVCAMNEGVIENCRNYGTVTAAQYYASGIVARNKEGGIVRDCYNAGTITTGSTYAAGIVAQINGAADVQRCQNDGFIRATKVTNTYETANLVGGIVAITAEGAKVTACVNNGTLSCYKYCGGIIGGLASGASVKGCLNTGNLLAEDPSEYFGAIIGENRATNAYTDNYYDGQIIPTGGAGNFNYAGLTGLNTADLTSGTAIEGLPDSIFDYTAGTYPVLKQFKDEKYTVDYRKMFLTLANGESTALFTSSATLNTADGLTWTIDNTDNFAIENNVLKQFNVKSAEYVNAKATMGDLYRIFGIMAVNNPFDGAGTAEDPYKIKTVDDMKTLSTYTNYYNVAYNDSHFIVTADLDFSAETNFTPIGWINGNKFQGDFNGDNHKISNITIAWNDKSADNNTYIGIFGYLGEYGTVRNLTIESGNISGYYYCGGLVGYCYGNVDNCVNKASISTTTQSGAAGLIAYLKSGKVTNCTNEGSVTSASTHAGGIVCYAASGSSVANCTNSGSISTAEGKGTAAGIVTFGSIDSIDNCVNLGTITAASGLAGIAASLSSTATTVTNCVNRGTFVSTAGSTMAGIAGTSYAHLKNCYNYSDITSLAGYAGGIVGTNQSGGIIEECDNYGSISAKKTYVGGIAAYGTSVSTIINCNNYGESISNASYYVGGIVGQLAGSLSEIRNCVNHANITGTTTSGYGYGGITGNSVGCIYNCINYGDVTTEAYSAGGISGQGSGKAFECINFGNVSTTYNVSSKVNGNAGGIWGQASYGITDCINYGNVTAVRYAGGILGYPTTSSALRRNYFCGTITTTDANTTGAICHKLATQTKVVVDSCYYNSDLNPDLAQSEQAATVSIAKTALELRSAALGDSFDYHDYSLPTLKSFKTSPEANAAAALVVFADNESAENFATNASIDLLDGIEWSVSSNIILEGNKLTANAPTKNSEGTITVVGGKIAREFKVILNNETSGIDNTYLNKEVLSTQYFSLEGYQLDEPLYNVVLIKRTTYVDGSVDTQKVILKK